MRDAVRLHESLNEFLDFRLGLLIPHPFLNFGDRWRLNRYLLRVEYDVPAEFRLDWLGKSSLRQCESGLVELWHHLPVAEFTEVTAPIL